MPLIVKKVAEVKIEEPVFYNTYSSLAALRNRNTPTVEPDPEPPEQIEETINEIIPVQEEQVEVEVKKGVSLVVDGKERKVSKTSKYLLDMLTLDDQ